MTSSDRPIEEVRIASDEAAAEVVHSMQPQDHTLPAREVLRDQHEAAVMSQASIAFVP